jgi:DNA-binding transcriptional MocR family regulator
VHEFVRRGNLGPNVERVSRLLKARRDAMVEAVDEHFPDAPRSNPEGGYFLWLDLPEGVDTAALLGRATEEGVTFVAGRDFFPGGAGGESSLRLAYSYVSPAEISDGIARLAECAAASVPV